MDKIKVLFQTGAAVNSKTGQVAEVVFQHFNRPFSFKDPRNAKFLEAMNGFREKTFDGRKPVTEGDLTLFNNQEVIEIVVSKDGTCFQRAHYKSFACDKWNPNNTDPLETKRKWKRLSAEEAEVVHTVTAKLNTSLGKLGSIFPNSDEMLKKVADASK